MEELKNLFHEVADDVVSMAQTIMDMTGKTDVMDYFPYGASRIVTINGKDYCVKVDIQMNEMKW